MSNVGKTLRDFFCNGFFGSDEYGLHGAKIVLENDHQIVVLKDDGDFAIGDFREDWKPYMQKHIDDWVNGKSCTSC